MKVLVIGGGGREHALAWKLAQSARVQQVLVAPGNGGTASDAALLNVPITDVRALREFAQAEKIGLTVVGPEAPLAAGVVDEFRAHGLRIFGPTQAAAQLESSKAFSKAFMQRHGIPTAAYDSFTDPAAAHAYIDRMGAPIVVKADGLAAGKGVVVAQTAAEAHAAVDDMLAANTYGVAHNQGGARVVIEEFLQGEEASFIVLCDGKNVAALATSQDHKRLLDGDGGPNTGGMGAYSPAPVVTAEVHARAMREIILPTMRGMAQDGIPYTGFLYAGLMIDAQGRPKTLEFNCRMGDPETQPILMRLKSDLLEVLLAATAEKLDTVELQWDRRPALGVVLAAHGYPLAPRKGDAITGLPTGGAPSAAISAGTSAAASAPTSAATSAAAAFAASSALPRPGAGSAASAASVASAASATRGSSAAHDSASQGGAPDVMTFHAGTALHGGQLVTSGGRVLCVTALGETIRQAQSRAYEAVAALHFDGMQYRKDIGHRAMRAATASPNASPNATGPAGQGTSHD